MIQNKYGLKVLSIILLPLYALFCLGSLHAQTADNSYSEINSCDFIIELVQVPDTNFYPIAQYSIFGGNKKQIKSIRINAPFRTTSHISSVEDSFICNYLDSIKNEGKLELDRCIIIYDNYQNLGTITFELYYIQKTD